MYHSSSQKIFWTFVNEDELTKLWKKADYNYRSSYCSKHETKDILDDEFFLTIEEHKCIVKHYESQMREFCATFKPPLPSNTLGTACSYMKRLYLKTSSMEYHPKIMFLVCVWLATKIDEFNVSITEFINNVTWVDKSKAITAILDLELKLVQKLNFHLTIHNPYRPFEGFLIDLKTRFPMNNDFQQLRPSAHQFILASFQTNVGLLYPPSQIALAALLDAAFKVGLNIDKYVTDVLVAGQPQETLQKMISRLRMIRGLVENANKNIPSEESVQKIKEKLNNCYAKEKDPMNTEYKKSDKKTKEEQKIQNNVAPKPPKKRKIKEEVL